MLRELSEQDRAERDRLIAEVHAAFAEVTREGAISWNESVAVDNFESEEACEVARRSDTDRHWHDLVEDERWQPFPGLGGFNFIDAKAYRYYLPPTMVRFLRGDVSEWFAGHLLQSINQYTEDHLLQLWTGGQLRVIARFMGFMASHDEDSLDSNGTNVWSDALHRRWNNYLTD